MRKYFFNTTFFHSFQWAKNFAASPGKMTLCEQFSGIEIDYFHTYVMKKNLDVFFVKNELLLSLNSQEKKTFKIKCELEVYVKCDYTDVFKLYT